MELLICWVAYPLLLAVVAQGCGALVALAAGRPLGATVRLPVGMALAIAVLDLATYTTFTAPLAVWIIAALTLAGWVVSWRSSAPDLRRLRAYRPSSALVAALLVFGVYAAPIVLSGMATWAGYIKLDDTSTWLALVDRALTHGHSLAGLAPSDYKLTLQSYLSVGYPLGSFLPLGLGHVFLGQDVAWLSDPWMAFMAAMLALSLHRVASLALPRSRGWQLAVIATVGAQPALLYGYYMWGGMKEMAGAMLVAAFATTAPLPLTGKRRVRALVPVAVVVWATIASLSAGGLVWLVPGLAIAAALAAAVSWRDLRRMLWPAEKKKKKKKKAAAGRPPGDGAAVVRSGGGGAGGVLAVARRPAVLWATAAAALAAIGAYLVFRPGGFVQRFHVVLTSGTQLGNLVRPLSIQQILGIWPTGDFRFAPNEAAITHVLEVLVAVAAVAALVLAVAQRRHELSLLLLCAVVGGLLIDALASPWLGGKGLATGSIAVPFAALVTAGWLLAAGHWVIERIAGFVLALLVVGGVLWSNVLAYHAVYLAPRQLMSELSYIGGRIAGQGPTLMDEFSSYGARHFLRDAAPESASDTRTRPDYLITGHGLQYGQSADISDFVLDSVLAYRTLVIQRGPANSRPPSPYSLTYQDGFWQVWQRAPRIDPKVLHQESFNTVLQPGQVPRCAAILSFAQLAGIHELVAAPARDTVYAAAASGTHPRAWSTDSSFLYLDGTGTATIPISVPVAGRYMLWLGGGVRGPVTLTVDGRYAGTARDQLMEPDQYVPYDSLTLSAGSHTVSLHYLGGGWRPGSGGPPVIAGPLALTLDAPAPALLYAAPSQARSLCGRNLSWIEGLAGRV